MAATDSSFALASVGRSLSPSGVTMHCNAMDMTREAYQYSAQLAAAGDIIWCIDWFCPGTSCCNKVEIV